MKKILITISLLTLLILSGCGNKYTDSKEIKKLRNNKNFEIITEGKVGNQYILLIKDKNIGKKYNVICTCKKVYFKPIQEE